MAKGHLSVQPLRGTAAFVRMTGTSIKRSKKKKKKIFLSFGHGVRRRGGVVVVVVVVVLLLQQYVCRQLFILMLLAVRQTCECSCCGRPSFTNKEETWARKYVLLISVKILNLSDSGSAKRHRQ